MEGKGVGIGIGIGVVIGILIGIIVSGGISTTNQSNPIADIIETDDARLASIQASYFEDNDRLVVALILTDKNAEYTKANGLLELRVLNDNGYPVIFEEYDVTRDDFFSWKDGSGEKVTGYRIEETKVFAFGSHDVYVDFTLDDGRKWSDIHASFFALN